MKLRVNALNIRQGDWLVQQLFVKRKREPSVETMTVKHSDSQNSPNKVEI